MDKEEKTFKEVKDWDELLLAQANDYNLFTCHKIFIDLTGDLVAGLMLGQLVYWYMPNKKGQSKLRVKKAGVPMVAKRRTDWEDELRISPKQVDRGNKILKEKGFIKTKLHRFNNAPWIHYSLEVDNLIAAYNDFMLNGQAKKTQKRALVDFPQRVKSDIPQRVKSDIPLLVKSLTENSKTETNKNRDDDLQSLPLRGKYALLVTRKGNTNTNVPNTTEASPEGTSGLSKNGAPNNRLFISEEKPETTQNVSEHTATPRAGYRELVRFAEAEGGLVNIYEEEGLAYEDYLLDENGNPVKDLYKSYDFQCGQIKKLFDMNLTVSQIKLFIQLNKHDFNNGNGHWDFKDVYEAMREQAE